MEGSLEDRSKLLHVHGVEGGDGQRHLRCVGRMEKKIYSWSKEEGLWGSLCFERWVQIGFEESDRMTSLVQSVVDPITRCLYFT